MGCVEFTPGAGIHRNGEHRQNAFIRRIERLSQPKQQRWNLGLFVTLNLVGLGLFLSWSIQGLPTRSIWDSLDEKFFAYTNGLLDSDSPYRLAVAIMSSRVFQYGADIIVFGAIGFHVLKKISFRPLPLVGEASIAAILWAALLIASKSFSTSLGRPGPTRFYDNAVELSNVYAWELKDAAHSSFPASQASIDLLALVVGLYFLRRVNVGVSVALLAVVLCCTLTIPRLLSGAHWLSDVTAGSAALALIFAGWVLGSPLIKACVPIAIRAFQLLKKRYANPQDEENL